MSEPVEDPGDPLWRKALIIGAQAAGSVALVVVAVLAFGWLRAPSLPDEAPEFVLRDLDGNRVALSDFRGKPVVLNFWATWCGPCRVEAPELAKFAAANPDVQVIGIAADGPASKVEAEARALGITYLVLQGDEQTLSAYDVDTFPTTVVVDGEGQVHVAYTGMVTRPQLALGTVGVR